MKTRGRSRIVLTGFMGTGKTLVGRIVAQELGWGFVDTDEAVEKQSGRRIADIFSEEGEAGFRRLEKAVLEQVLLKDRVVIASGGGAIIDADNRARMKEGAWLVCLEAGPEVILQRLRGSHERPLLATTDPLAEIRRLIEERRPFYEEADDVIKTDHKKAAEIAKELVRRYQEQLAGETATESL